ncbi:hypothetical protein HN446_02755 [bacterium]|nr:hypothetical protein [bacterium]
MMQAKLFLFLALLLARNVEAKTFIVVDDEETPKNHVGKVIFDQVGLILAKLGDVAEQPSNPDKAESLLKKIIGSAFIIGKTIAAEEKNTKKSKLYRSAKIGYEPEDLWESMNKKQQQNLMHLACTIFPNEE